MKNLFLEKIFKVFRFLRFLVSVRQFVCLSHGSTRVGFSVQKQEWLYCYCNSTAVVVVGNESLQCFESANELL